jgi:hypothetical protein
MPGLPLLSLGSLSYPRNKVTMMHRGVEKSEGRGGGLNRRRFQGDKAEKKVSTTIIPDFSFIMLSTVLLTNSDKEQTSLPLSLRLNSLK